jgi:hypothetical protein
MLSLLAGAGCLLTGTDRAEAVITGLVAIPVSFEQGWLDEVGQPISTGSSPTSISQDALVHQRVIKAWKATNHRYCTVRLYITTDNATTPVNGIAADGDGQFDLRLEMRPWSWSQPGRGFFNYAPASNQHSAGPQPFAAVNTNQGQRAFDSYLTVNGADRDGDAGAAIEGSPDQNAFNALRGASHVFSEVATGQTGGLGGAGASSATFADTWIHCPFCL